MSGVKEPMQETNSGLLDLEVLLHRANSLRPLQSERILPNTEGPPSSRLRENEVLRQQGGGILIFDGRSAARMEPVIDPLEATRGCRLEHVSQDVLLAAEPLRGDVVCLKTLRKEGADRSARRWEDARNFKLNGYLIAVKDGFRHGLSEPGETRIQRQTGTAFQKAMYRFRPSRVEGKGWPTEDEGNIRQPQ